MSLFCRDVDIVYGAKTILRDVSLAIPPGKVVLLYGPSGHGKTSLFKILCGLQQPTFPRRSVVYWQDYQLRNLRKAHKVRHRYISMIFSRFNFLSGLSVRENLTLPALLQNQTRSEIQKRLDRLFDIFSFDGDQAFIDLRNVVGSSDPGKPAGIDNLSNGQKEMVAIARALMTDGSFLMADELLRSFDHETEQAVWKRLLGPELGIGRDRALFLITHKRHLANDSKVHAIYRVIPDEHRVKEEV